MLIKTSGDKPFIFLANPKCASSSIHSCDEITRHCEIRIRNSFLGKHISLLEIQRRYDWLFKIVPFETFNIVFIIREPIDWYLSYYRYRSNNQLRNHQKSSFGMNPEEYYFNVFQNEKRFQTNMLNIPNMKNNLLLIRFGKKFITDYQDVFKELKVGNALQLKHINRTSYLENTFKKSKYGIVKSCVQKFFQYSENINNPASKLHDNYKLSSTFTSVFESDYKKDIELWEKYLQQ